MFNEFYHGVRLSRELRAAIRKGNREIFLKSLSYWDLTRLREAWYRKYWPSLGTRYNHNLAETEFGPNEILDNSNDLKAYLNIGPKTVELALQAAKAWEEAGKPGLEEFPE